MTSPSVPSTASSRSQRVIRYPEGWYRRRRQYQPQRHHPTQPPRRNGNGAEIRLHQRPISAAYWRIERGEHANEGNRFLANMQIDVKETAPETQFTTSLTNGRQAEANLHCAALARPGRLGASPSARAISTSSATNTHQAWRELRFYNPTKVSARPRSQTRVRVDAVNFAGPSTNSTSVTVPIPAPAKRNHRATNNSVLHRFNRRQQPSGARGSFLKSGANSPLGSAISPHLQPAAAFLRRQPHQN